MNTDFFDIPGYNGKYVISKSGVVKNIKTGNTIKSVVANRGYVCVVLSRSAKDHGRQLLHRLLALTFIPNPDNKRTINHKNGIKTDNRLENLEWATDKENINHAFDNGLNDHSENHYAAKIKNADVPKILELISSGMTQKEIGKIYGVHQSQISDLKNNKSFKRPVPCLKS